MAERVMNWRVELGVEDLDILDMKEFFAEGARMGRELQRRMEEEKLSEGSEEEEKPSEGPEEEIGGEDMDFEKAVKTRVRKRCDLHMDEEEEEVRAEEMEEPKDDDAAMAKEKERKKSLSDYNANKALEYPSIWNTIFSKRYGSYEDTTSIPAMRFTNSGRCAFVGTHETLQIFSVKVVEIEEGLQWPLDIYGMVAIRDVVDYNCNIIFDRKRDNCHTITAEDPYLALVGPSRAVLLSMRLSVLEVGLYLKGDTESDDQEFSLFITSYIHFFPRSSIANDRRIPSRLSTLEMTVGYIVNSVEATLSVEVTHGSSWPDGYRGEFAASTASIDDMEILLLAFGEDKLPAGDDDKIKLSRCVISVEHPEHGGRLIVSARALRGTKEEDVLTGEVVFTSQEAGQSKQKFKVGSCEMVATVAWSLLSSWAP